MGVTQIKEWYKRFKNGHTSVDSKPCSGWPSTSQNDQVIAKVSAVMMGYHHVTIQEIAEEVDISNFSAHSILTEDLIMKRVVANFVYVFSALTLECPEQLHPNLLHRLKALKRTYVKVIKNQQY